MMEVHPPNRVHAPTGFRVFYELSKGAEFAPIQNQTGANFAPVPDSVLHHHDGDLDHPSPELKDRIITTTTAPPAREDRGAKDAPLEIVEQLTTAGVTNPRRWIAEFGAPRCQGALYTLDRSPRGTVHNPAGFMRSLLAGGAPLTTTPALDPNSLEARKAKYGR
jgi:hypothetical protein